ncbi:MAG: glycosyltransferase family 2 protein [Deltaproteobacteria bacterium]|jgi:dolichyl-phosphate beta-glucosyltransferase|nr:glycosyltransferase family 2 protein [Deltaproteobacteria bacterium]
MTENLDYKKYKNAKTSLSIIIPAYNEEKRIKQTIIALRSYLKPKKYIYEIIVVDDGSTDGTLSVLKDTLSADLRVITITKSGKGAAVKEGVMSADKENEYVFFMDADLSTDPSEIGAFIDIFKEEPETNAIIGSRYLPEGSVIIQPPFRNLVGRTFSLIKSKLLGINFFDSQCGFKAFRMQTAKKLFAKSEIKGFSFDVEILYIALLNGIKVKEKSVNWHHKPGGHVNLIADSIPMLIELFQVFLNRNKYFL